MDEQIIQDLNTEIDNAFSPEGALYVSFIPGLSIKIPNYLDRNAFPEDREAHIDIADLMLLQNALIILIIHKLSYICT